MGSRHVYPQHYFIASPAHVTASTARISVPVLKTDGLDLCPASVQRIRDILWQRPFLQIQQVLLNVVLAAPPYDYGIAMLPLHL